MKQRCLFGKNQDLLQLLEDVPGYPFDIEKDTKMITILKSEFPGVDLEETIKQFRMWTLEHKTKNYRLMRLRNFCKLSGNGSASKRKPARTHEYFDNMDVSKWNKSEQK
jgi:hypothetical protein